MNYQRSVVRFSRFVIRNRNFSDKANAVTENIKPSGNGGGLMQRLSAFFVGVGLGLGASFYLIYNELSEANELFGKHLTTIDRRLADLEARK